MLTHAGASGAPQSLEAMFVQPTAVFLRWREVPCFQQNDPITGYVVRYYATCGADRNLQQNKSVVTTGGIIDGLTPNTEYAFQVAAVNVNGTGSFSEPITVGGKWYIANCILMYGFSQSTVEPHFKRQELCLEAIFGNFRYYQKLPKMATLPIKFCYFWQSFCIARFFFPILAIHKVCQKWQNLPPRVAKNGNFGYYYRFAIIGNIYNSSISS